MIWKPCNFAVHYVRNPSQAQTRWRRPVISMHRHIQFSVVAKRQGIQLALQTAISRHIDHCLACLMDVAMNVYPDAITQ